MASLRSLVFLPSHFDFEVGYKVDNDIDNDFKIEVDYSVHGVGDFDVNYDVFRYLACLAIAVSEPRDRV